MASSLLLRETVAGAALPSFPPGQQMASPELCTKAPGNTVGSFLIDPNDAARAEWGARFPVDEITGLPFPILTVNTHEEVVYGGVTNHHHPNYDRRDPDLEGNIQIETGGARPSILDRLYKVGLSKLGGLAVRVSRTQRLVPELHGKAHQKYPKGPILPHEVGEKHLVALKNCLGVVPRVAVDVTAPPDKRFNHMDDTVFKAVAEAWSIHVERYYFNRPEGYQNRILGAFFIRSVLNNDLSHMAPAIESFLGAKDRPSRRILREKILDELVDMSLQPLLPDYKEFKKAGMLQPGSLSAHSALKDYMAVEWRMMGFHLLQQRAQAIAA